MKNIFRNITIKITALLLLILFVFSFLRSELGFLYNDGDNQECSNYCEIIKNADTHSKILREELPAKLKLNKNICIHCFEEAVSQATKNSFEITDHHLKAKPYSGLYLFNRTFLI